MKGRSKRQAQFDRKLATMKGRARRRVSSGPGSVSEQLKLMYRIERSLIKQGHSRFVACETAIHMSDWLNDLYDLYDLYSGRSRWTAERVDHLFLQFLIHVPNHIAAAAKVFADFPVSDLFEVGAVPGSEAKRTARTDTTWRRGSWKQSLDKLKKIPVKPKAKRDHRSRQSGS